MINLQSHNVLLLAAVCGMCCRIVDGFGIPPLQQHQQLSIALGSQHRTTESAVRSSFRYDFALEMSAGDKKRKRRRRKPVPGATAPDPVKNAQETTEALEDDDDDEDEDDLSQNDLMQIEDVAKFVYKPKTDVAVSGK
jgi:hypothetical protein